MVPQAKRKHASKIPAFFFPSKILNIPQRHVSLLWHQVLRTQFENREWETWETINTFILCLISILGKIIIPETVPQKLMNSHRYLEIKREGCVSLPTTVL